MQMFLYKNILFNMNPPSQTRRSKDSGNRHPCVLKHEPVGRKTDLVEQRILAGTEGREIMAFGRRGRQFRGTKECHEVTKGEKLEGPKPS